MKLLGGLAVSSLFTQASAGEYKQWKLQERDIIWLSVGQAVDTSSGPVQGHSARNATEVSEYLGIPYVSAHKFKFLICVLMLGMIRFNLQVET